MWLECGKIYGFSPTIASCKTLPCWKTNSRYFSSRPDEANDLIEGTHMARNCRWPLGIAWNLQLTISKELSEQSSPDGPPIWTQFSKGLEKSLQSSKQMAQLICDWIPDPQKLWDNKHTFCLSCWSVEVLLWSTENWYSDLSLGANLSVS